MTNELSKQPAKRIKMRQRGATIIEYAILVGVLSIGMIGILATVKGAINDGFEDVAEAIKDAPDAAPK